MYGSAPALDEKLHCKRLHLYKTERLTVRVCTCTRQKTLLYESAPAQEGKPHCTGMHMYKTENLTVRVCNCTRRKT